MNKKIYLLFILFLCFILVGCTKKNEIICILNEESIYLTFKDGKIIKYLDKNKKEQSKDVINEMNSYIMNIDNNKDSIKIITEIIKDFGGNCK